MIVAAAFCPHPPLLHPQALGAAGQELGSALLAACARALGRVLAAEPDSVLILGAGGTPAPDETAYGPGDAGDLIGYGVPLRVGFDGPPQNGGARLPLAHTLGAWLLDEAGFRGRRLGVAAGSTSAQARSPGWDDRRWALLVMGDGSARRTQGSPGWYDPDALAFDQAVQQALAGGQGKALLDLDRQLGERVLAAGIASWHAAGQMLEPTPMSAELQYADSPFGVFYAVASWVAQ